MTIQMKFFSAVFFVVLYKVILAFNFVDETLGCNQSNESSSCGTLCGSSF